jgi:hypothetical protein
MGDAYSLPSFAGSYQPPGTHPHYIVGKPGGCDGRRPCREVHFILDPSVDSGTIDRLMQFDLSCLSRWIHLCRTEGDIMPNAWRQAEVDYPPSGVKLRPSERRYKPYIVVLLVLPARQLPGRFAIHNLTGPEA